MDNVDKKMLAMLQENARATISVMSAAVSLSMPAVSERLKKLEASGVIKQYTAILDPTLVDKQLMAFVFISFEKPDNADAFRGFVIDEADIKECFYITGDYDFVLKVVTKNTTTMEELLTRIKNQTGVRKTHTDVVLSSVVDKPSIVLS